MELTVGAAVVVMVMVATGISKHEHALEILAARTLTESWRAFKPALAVIAGTTRPRVSSIAVRAVLDSLQYWRSKLS